MEALLAAASEQGKDENGVQDGVGEGQRSSNGGGAGGGSGEAEGVDPAKRAKALNKKLKKLEVVKTKKDAGEPINSVSAQHVSVTGRVRVL